MDPKKPLDISGLSAFAEAFSKGFNKNGEKPSWWQTYQYPEPHHVYSEDLIGFTKIALFFQALTFNSKVCDYEYDGDFVGTDEAVIVTLEKNGAKLIYESLEKSFNKRAALFFIIDDGALYVEINHLKRPKLQYNCVSSNKNTIEKMKSIMKGFFSTTLEKNPVFMLSTSKHDTEFIKLGTFSIPLNYDNYNSDVIKDFHYVAKQFNSSEPSGRLLILNGLPGTGKTYLIRGLLNELNNGTFLLLPSDMIQDLSKPSLIQTISEASQNKFANGPLYLVIEDADIALLRRGGDNMGIISTLLNLADGLLGSAFDLRIIATTNANKLDMEPAILRPGRLCKSICIDKLPAEQANILLKKLNPKSEKKYTSSVILADVYASVIED